MLSHIPYALVKKKNRTQPIYYRTADSTKSKSTTFRSSYTGLWRLLGLVLGRCWYEM